MPRPKRTKVAPSVPRPNFRIARRAPSDPIEDVIEGDSQAPESTRSKRVKTSNQSTAKSAQLNLQARSYSNATDAGRTRGMKELRHRRDSALERLDAENEPSTTESDIPIASTERIVSSPPVEVGRKARGGSDAESSVLPISNFRRARQPSILGRGRRGRSSSVESDLAESTGLVNRPRKDNSLAGVRRRPRQPSILGRRARSSSIGLDMTPANPGSALNVRRRARQPSILGRARKQMLSEGEDDNLDDFLDEDDFAPEDESTPLNINRSRSAAEASTQSMSSTSKSRKRKQSPLDEPELSERPAEVEEDQSEIESEIESEPVQEAPRPQTPEPFSETMAPPQSSSPASEILRPSRRANMQPAQPSTRRQPSRKQAPPPLSDDDSLPSSPPSLTHSPNHRVASPVHTTRRARAVPDPANFSTLQLQTLLPRRRHRNRDAFAIDSDDEAPVDITGLGSDDDELSHLNVRARAAARRTPAPAPPRRVTKLKGKNTASKRTYGSSTRQDSDEENSVIVVSNEEEVDPNDSLAPLPDNEEDEAESSQVLEERVGKELKRAKRKFEVVDKWELEFEDCTASSSSPRDAR